MADKVYNIASNSDILIRAWGYGTVDSQQFYQESFFATSSEYAPSEYPQMGIYVPDHYPQGEFNYVMETAFYFSSIDIPKSATITSAKLNFTTNVASGEPQCSGTFSLDIQACDEDSSARISSLADFGNRARTTEKINWSGAAVSANTNYDTTDFKSVIQEIIDRGSWASGNHLQLIISDHTYKYNSYPTSENIHAIVGKLDSVANISLNISYISTYINKYESVLQTNIKKVNGVAIANVKKLMGVA